MTFGVHKLVRSVPFSTTHANFDNCYQHCIATCGENVSVHIYVLGTKLQQLNFINFLCSLYEVVLAHFLADFGIFTIFLTAVFEYCGVT